MTSEVRTFRVEKRPAVRVKEEKASCIECTSGHFERELWLQAIESNSDNSDMYKSKQQQAKDGQKTKLQGYRVATSRTKIMPSVTVKQERDEEFDHNAGHKSGTPASSFEEITTKNHETIANKLDEDSNLDNMKKEDFKYLSRPESQSRPESPTSPEKRAFSQSSPRDSENLFLPWQPMEQLKDSAFGVRKNPPYPRTSYLCFPGKRTHCRVLPPNSVESTPKSHILEQYFGKDAKADSIAYGQERFCQHEENIGFSSIYDDENEYSDGRIKDRLGSKPRKKSISPTGKAEQNECTQTKDENISQDVNTKDEEPVWKKYQWYRDRKRPYSLQIKRHNAEQPVFKQYNDIRDKRFKEGRVVIDKRRVSEPWNFPEENRKACPPSFNRASYRVISHTDTVEPIKRRKISHGSELSGDGGYFHDNETADQDAFRKEHIAFHYNFEGEALNGTDEHRNFDKHNAVQSGLCPSDEKATNTCKTTINSDSGVSLNNDDDDIDDDANDDNDDYNAVFEEKVDVRPGALRHYPQDVAKILRLNRIVKAVRSNSVERKSVEKMKTTQPTSPRDEDKKSVASETLEHRGLENGPAGITDERAESTSETPNDFSYPEDDERFVKNRNKKLVEGRQDFPSLAQSPFDQKPVDAEQVNVQNDDDPVCQVNGLLSLPGLKETKFSISLGELKRRMNPPETLTRVEMISYVRQAKSAGRTLLDSHNIVTANRSHPTVLSRVCESEAQVLADGILKMNKEYMPMAFLARKTVNAYKDDGCRVDNCEDCRLKLRRRIVDVEITRNSLKELQKVIEQTKKESAFETFDLASHTFGVSNIRNHLTLLDDYFRLLLLTLQDE